MLGNFKEYQPRGNCLTLWIPGSESKSGKGRCADGLSAAPSGDNPHTDRRKSWYVTPALEGWRQKDHEFEPNPNFREENWGVGERRQGEGKEEQERMHLSLRNEGSPTESSQLTRNPKVPPSKARAEMTPSSIDSTSQSVR